jgi:simple sugar transport system ATP-binding protein
MRLELRGITKRFATLVANDHIDLVVEPGQIHCLLGENGAGKSTLMNCLYGLYTPDEGEILLDDEVVHFTGPGDAQAAGIGMVHQHFMLVPVFSVAENVMLGNEASKGVALDLDAARAKVRAIAGRFNFHVDPDAIIEDLPVGVQQRVEIIKALSRDAHVLVFDEPTAVLTPQETDELMEIMKQLRDEGAAIVFITHKLREVRAIADKITVIRRGAVVGEASPTPPDAELAAIMVGRAVELAVIKGEPQHTDTSLVVKDLTVTSATGQVLVDEVSFEVKGGEILAIAGVQGNGQTELTEALMGLEANVEGSILLGGRELVGRSVRQVLDAGVGFIPEDRTHDGLVGTFTIAENLMLDRSDGPPFVKGGAIQIGFRDEFARQKVEEYDVRTQGIHQEVGRLSGGNAQKVIVAREMSRDLSLLLAAQPTRGVDVGSIEFIYKRIVEMRDSGCPVVVVSTELDEATQLGDRIMVMYKGGIVGVVPADTPRDVLGLMMAGIAPEAIAATQAEIAAEAAASDDATPSGDVTGDIDETGAAR